MPLTFGGGVRSLEDIKELFALGLEKVAINSLAAEEPEFIRRAADQFGSQSIAVSIDAARSFLGKYSVFTHSGRKNTHLNPAEFALSMERQGAGEIFLNSIECDGTMQGYDLELIRKVSEAVSIPVIACGGAGNVDHMADAIVKAGASAASAGSMFVFHGKHRAVLISYPTRRELEILP